VKKLKNEECRGKMLKIFPNLLGLNNRGEKFPSFISGEKYGF
jgi:hypothetical protein